MKRMLALLLCLMMCASLIPAAYAEDLDDTNMLKADTDKPFAKLTITTQPASRSTSSVTNVKAAGKADNTDLYREYFCRNNAGTGNLSAATLSTSKKPVITTQPSSQMAAVDSKVKFTVKATGAKSYQWQYRKSSGDPWTNSKASSSQTETLTLTAKAAYNGYEFRCEVTNSKGTTYSDTATLTVVSEKPVITTQPASQTAYVGTTVKFTVKATGADGYQWYYRKDANASWEKSKSSGNTSDTLRLEAKTYRSGYQFRCAVSNPLGTSFSDAATLTVSEKPVITKQPVSQKVDEDTTATFTVKATGATSYQWQYRMTSSGDWQNSKAEGSKSASVTITAAASSNGFQYRCKVMNTSGTTYSDVVTLTVTIKPKITTQPLSYTAFTGAAVRFTVEAKDAESFQWYYRKNTDENWEKSTASGNTTETLSVEATEEYDGCQFKCVIKNATGKTQSKAVSLTVSTKPCGDNLRWVLDSGGLLTISGTGKMYDFYDELYDYIYVPWGTQPTQAVLEAGVTNIGKEAFSGCSALTNVTIPASVTGIGEAAFSDCSALTSVKIPDSVTGVGEDAFSGCSALKSLTIGNSVTSIGDYAFSGCSALKSLTIPASVTSIGDYAFSGCSALKNVTIPASVTEIGLCAFFHCGRLKDISVADGNINYSSQDGVLFNNEKSELIQYPGGKSGEYTIPGSVTEIGSFAFRDCTAITGVAIPDSVTSIDDEAFCGCSSLMSVTVGSIETGDYEESFGSSLLPGVRVGVGTTSIGAEAFSGCSALTNVTMGNRVTGIGDRAFYGCSGLTNVTIPDSVTEIGALAFCGCSGLTSVTIGNGVTRIGEEAFEHCGALTSVTIGNSVTEIKENAFNGCSGLTNVTIPDSVTSIEEDAFEYCSGLTSVTIGSGVTDIANSAFYFCSSLTSIAVADGNIQYASQDGVLFNYEKTELICCPGGRSGAYTIPAGVTSIGDCAFINCSALTNLTIGDSVTHIGNRAFYGCCNLTGVAIPASVTSVSSSAFDGCSSLRLIAVASSNKQYASQDGALFNYAKTELLRVPGGKSGAYTIPAGVTAIGRNAFKGCSGLTSVTIPTGVTSIGDCAFEACTALTSLMIPDGVTSIGNSVCYGCGVLTSVMIPDSVTGIGWHAFSNCSALAGVTIGSGVTGIGCGAFKGCISLTSVTIQGGVTGIANDAFCGCSELKDVYYKGTEEQWSQISINSDNDPLLNATIHYNA